VQGRVGVIGRTRRTTGSCAPTGPGKRCAWQASPVPGRGDPLRGCPAGAGARGRLSRAGGRGPHEPPSSPRRPRGLPGHVAPPRPA
jgi:hypothetical protein